jgi:flagellar biosynthesis GTPase FlhF
MIKIKELLIIPTILVIVVTFFGGIAFAAKVTSINKEKSDVFVNDAEGYGLIRGTGKCFLLPSGEQLVDKIVQEIFPSEFVVEKNRKLVEWERKERKSTYQKWKEVLDKQSIIQNDYIKRRQEEERIKEQEEERMQEQEEERMQEQEEERMQEQEKRQEQEKIKKEDWFR